MNERGWTMYKLAKEADLPYSSLNNIFQRNTEPTIPTLRNICKGLDISLSEFFSDEPSPTRYDFTSDEKSLLIEYRSMRKSDKQLLKTYAAGLNKKLPENPE